MPCSDATGFALHHHAAALGGGGVCTPHPTPAPAGVLGQGGSFSEPLAAMDNLQLAELLLALQQQEQQMQMQVTSEQLSGSNHTVPAPISSDLPNTDSLLNAEQAIDAEIQQLLAFKHARQAQAQRRPSDLMYTAAGDTLPSLNITQQDFDLAMLHTQSPGRMALSEHAWGAAAAAPSLSPRLSPTSLAAASQAAAFAAASSSSYGAASRASIDLGYLQHTLQDLNGGALTNGCSPDVRSAGSADALTAPTGSFGAMQGGLQSPFAVVPSLNAYHHGAATPDLALSPSGYGSAVVSAHTPEPQDTLQARLALDAALDAALGGLSTQDVSFLYAPQGAGAPALSNMGSAMLSPAPSMLEQQQQQQQHMSQSGPLALAPSGYGLMLLGQQDGQGLFGHSASSSSMHAAAFLDADNGRPRRHSFHVAPMSAQQAVYGDSASGYPFMSAGGLPPQQPQPGAAYPPTPCRSSIGSNASSSSRMSLDQHGSRTAGMGGAQHGMPDAASRRRHSLSERHSLSFHAGGPYTPRGQGMPCVQEAHSPESGAAAAAAVAARSAITGSPAPAAGSAAPAAADASKAGSRSSSRQRGQSGAKVPGAVGAAAADACRRSLDLPCKSAAPRWAGSFWHPLVDVLKSEEPNKKKGTGVFMPRVAAAPLAPAAAAAAAAATE